MFNLALTLVVWCLENLKLDKCEILRIALARQSVMATSALYETKACDNVNEWTTNMQNIYGRIELVEVVLQKDDMILNNKIQNLNIDHEVTLVV